MLLGLSHLIKYTLMIILTSYRIILINQLILGCENTENEKNISTHNYTTYLLPII